MKHARYVGCWVLLPKPAEGNFSAGGRCPRTHRSGNPGSARGGRACAPGDRNSRARHPGEPWPSLRTLRAMSTIAASAASHARRGLRRVASVSGDIVPPFRGGSDSERIYVLFFVSLVTRRIEYIACTPNPDGRWGSHSRRATLSWNSATSTPSGCSCTTATRSSATPSTTCSALRASR